MLGSSDEVLADRYDLAMLDLDGVVYVGNDAVPGAADHLAAARSAGLRLAFITNNAARPPDDVADHLVELGVPATAADVVTSAQAAARLLVDRLGVGAKVAPLGARGIDAALEAEQLVPVAVDDSDAQALVTGYGPDVPWRDIMRAAVRIRDGLWWVACNTDLTIPTAYGLGPGHGVQVDMLRRFTGVDPVVAGKPARPLLDETVRRVGGRHPLMVGDRLDTDIEGGQRAGVDSLLVMTGVTRLAELVAAAPGERPTYLAADLGGLTSTHPEVSWDGERAAVGGWTTTAPDGRLDVSGEGSLDDWWRAVATVSWHHLDDAGQPVDPAGASPPG